MNLKEKKLVSHGLMIAGVIGLFFLAYTNKHAVPDLLTTISAGICGVSMLASIVLFTTILKEEKRIEHRSKNRNQ